MNAAPHSPGLHPQALTFLELLSPTLPPLALDDYQRNYVWDQANLERLLHDLEEYVTPGGPPKPAMYYLGTLLLHRAAAEEGKRTLRYIVDGQQRITTLLILFRHLAGPDALAALEVGGLQYTPEALENITANWRVLQKRASTTLTAEIFGRLQFTVIEVDSIDDAFTFFDTQNSRGKPLATTDLLKAHHLRVLTRCTQAERLTEYCAGEWESLQNDDDDAQESRDFAPELFRYLLHLRRWRHGRGIAWGGERTVLLQEFQERTLPDERRDGSVPVYRPVATEAYLRVGVEGQLSLEQTMPLTSRSAIPCVVRQPITEGLGFFLYSKHYAELYRHLWKERHEGELGRTIAFFNAVWSGMAAHLQGLYRLALLAYLDRFDGRQIFEFALWLDYSLGSVRLWNGSIPWGSQRIYLEERGFHLLDLITSSYAPAEVLATLRNDAKAAEIYRTEEWPIGAGAGGQYKWRLLHFYGRQQNVKLGTAAERAAWIAAQLRQP